MDQHESDISRGLWGAFTIRENEGGRFRIGPATLWIHRWAFEWRVGYVAADDALRKDVEVCLPCPEPEPEPGAQIWRFGVKRTSGGIELAPALADRPVVSRPETPFYLPPQEEATLYVSTPLWVTVRTLDPSLVLKDVPAYRPSDTWFGPSTLEGELCYALRTSARLELGAVPLRAHRAVTAVVIRNKDKTTLLLERLKLPVQLVALYRDKAGSHWTETLIMEREESRDLASLKVSKQPPKGVQNAVKISGPRQRPEHGIMTWTLGALFG
jgi:hypothetical protein